ncbi:MAG: DivIVA domain-containing protein [Bacilli bacterium]|nr:DivIVA domain-containing protein [Bacilli bacterium]
MKLILSSKEILNKKFKANQKGYDPDDVDAFLDKVLEDYKQVEKENSSYEAKITELKRENESLKTKLREKDSVISMQKSKNVALSTPHQKSLDNIELLQRCSAYEKKLYSLGIDPSKIK